MLIKMKDYERIYQIISAVIKSEDWDPTYSCILYSLFGANVLVDHYGLEARVRIGLATYHLGDDQDVLCFGEMSESGITSSNAGFHCWVVADDWIFDFMAPNFRELRQTEFTKRPRMFQRKFSDMVDHPNDMTKAGDFFLSHNPDLVDPVLNPYVEKPAFSDLALLCSQWFRKPPKKIPDRVATMDQNGKQRPVILNPTRILSRW